MQKDLGPAVDLIRSKVPDLVAVYLFGSAARGDQTPQNDIDLAFLSPRPLRAKVCWDLQQGLAVLLHRDVDLIDLRATPR